MRELAAARQKDGDFVLMKRAGYHRWRGLLNAAAWNKEGLRPRRPGRSAFLIYAAGRRIRGHKTHFCPEPPAADGVGG